MVAGYHSNNAGGCTIGPDLASNTTSRVENLRLHDGHAALHPTSNRVWTSALHLGHAKVARFTPPAMNLLWGLGFLVIVIGKCNMG